MPKPPKPMFLCPVCGKPFFLRLVLDRHIRRWHSR